MEPDEAINAARDGDAAAFADVYRSLAPMLLRYARGLVGQDAEDVVAEAWLQIARDIRRFHGGPREFRAWAARIVRNRALDQLRSSARHPAQTMPSADLPEQPTVADAETSALEHLSTDAAIELIATLPRDQAEAVLLRAVVGLDAATAGSVVGKSAGAIRVASHRGLRSLAKRLRGAERARFVTGPGEGRSLT
jgi:RNA polymerase sigma-70 factor (ECF subfamily)